MSNQSIQRNYGYESIMYSNDRSQFQPPMNRNDVYYRDELNDSMNEKYDRMDDIFRYGDVNIFQRFEKYFMTFGAFVDKWPRPIVMQHGSRRLRKIVADSIENPQNFAMCPNHVKQRIFAVTALRRAVVLMRYGRFNLPFELELMYKDGWERSCDICLIKEMDMLGLDCYNEYLKNDCIYYVLTNVMKFDEIQKYMFIQQRCTFIIQCLLQSLN